MSQLTTAVAGADESYLCTLANKGLYKRAERELGAAGVKAELTEEHLRAVFADGTEVEIKGTLQNYTCSCPSRSICKHVLMAIMAAQRQAGAESDGRSAPGASDAPGIVAPSELRNSEVQPPSSAAESKLPAAEPELPAAESMSSLLEVTPEALSKLAGKRVYQKAVLELASLGEAQIQEGSTVTVLFPERQIQVHFLPKSELKNASCSCKSPDFCIHKTSALLQYIKYKKGELPERFVPILEEDQQEFRRDTLPVIQEFVESILATGLVRLGEDTASRFGQIAVICHSQRFASMERLCTRIEGRLKRYYSRSAAFDQRALIDDLCQLMSLCRQMGSKSVDSRVLGVFREEYHPVSELSLHGLGARGWHTESGYTGVTVYFYNSGDSSVMTFTSAMPDSSQKTTPEKLFASGSPWGVPAKLSSIAHSSLQLSKAKISRKGQISSSSESAARITGRTDLLSEGLSELQHTEFKGLTELLSAAWEQEKKSVYVVLVPERYGKISFDEKEQLLELPVFDSAGRSVILTVKYADSGKHAVENLRRLETAGKLSGSVLVEAQLGHGCITAYPITLYMERGEALNLTMSWKTKTKRPTHSFNWNV